MKKIIGSMFVVVFFIALVILEVIDPFSSSSYSSFLRNFIIVGGFFNILIWTVLSIRCIRDYRAERRECELKEKAEREQLRAAIRRSHEIQREYLLQHGHDESELAGCECDYGSLGETEAEYNEKLSLKEGFVFYFRLCCYAYSFREDGETRKNRNLREKIRNAVMLLAVIIGGLVYIFFCRLRDKLFAGLKKVRSIFPWRRLSRSTK